MTRNRLTVLAIASLLLAASAAPADMMTFDGVALASNVQIHCDGLAADGVTVRAGKYDITYAGTQYQAFCVDADHWAGSGEVVEQSVNFLHNGERIAYLFETYSGEAATGTAAAAVAVAIWELLYETDSSFDADGGSFHITGNDTVALAANGLLATVPAAYTPAGALTVLHSEDKQDMLIGTLGEVPEPATICLLGLGGWLSVLRRQRRKA